MTVSIRAPQHNTEHITEHPSLKLYLHVRSVDDELVYGFTSQKAVRTYSLHCSSSWGYLLGSFYIELVNPQKKELHWRL